jgi:hypothetical protein
MHEVLSDVTSATPDEVGFVLFSKLGADLLFSFISARAAVAAGHGRGTGRAGEHAKSGRSTP